MNLKPNVKGKSRYLTDEKIAIIYESFDGRQVRPSELALIKILHRTGMRISEVSNYVQICVATPAASHVTLEPKKRNNQRVVPNACSFVALQALEILGRFGCESLRKLVARVSKASGIPFSAHDFRATFITNALNRGIEMPLLMIMTGHKSISSLMKYNRLTTINQIYLYDYITSPYATYERSEDIFVLKRKLRDLERENARLKHRMQPLKKKWIWR